MRITRRTFGTGVVGLGLAGALAAPVFAEPPSAGRLSDELNRRLVENPAQARFDVTAFDVRRGGAVRMVAEVRLDWAPGMRVRRVEGAGSSDAEAWGLLVAASMAEFAGVVPGFDGGEAAA